MIIEFILAFIPIQLSPALATAVSGGSFLGVLDIYDFLTVLLFFAILIIITGYGKSFSNTQKILLSTDGSITAILDVLYGKISLDTLEQHVEEYSEENAKLINAEPGEDMNYREIIMHKDDLPLIYAV